MNPTTPAVVCSGVALRFVDFPEGAVVMNLVNGAYFRLNSSAREICRQLQAGATPPEVARQLASRFAVPVEQAEADVAALLRQLRTVSSATGGNPLAFVPDGDRLLLCWEQRPVLALLEDGKQISAQPASGVPASVKEIAGHLLWAVPHLLALQGQLVLHASAVQLAAGVAAFCGPSGIGKTTLAARFTAAGAAALAEDLLAICFREGRPQVLVGAEAWLRAWVRRQAPELAAGRTIDGSGLAIQLPAVLTPLAEVWFVHRRELAQPVIEKFRLPAPDGLACLLHNSFAELQLPTVWEWLFINLGELAGSVSLFQAALPNGLDALDQAVAAYTRMVSGNAPSSD
jgi:hypothetical protein